MTLVRSFAVCCVVFHSFVVASAQLSGVNYIVAVRGKVDVQRPGWSEYLPVRLGMSLGKDVLLRLDDGSSITIACADLRIMEVVLPGHSGIPCPVELPTLYWKHDVVDHPRASSSRSGTPQIISPRMTKLLDPNPIIRWAAVPNATSYRVRVEPGASWSSVVEGKTELQYPGAAPRLLADKAYIVVVAVEKPDRLRGFTSEETGTDLGFAILSTKVGEGIRETEKRIQILPISAASKHFLVAALYASSGLRAEAIAALDLVSDERLGPRALSMEADLYSEIGLFDIAARRYLAAFDAAAGDDLDLRASVSDALSVVYGMMGMGKVPEVRKQAEVARDAYARLGDKKGLEKVAERLRKLPPQ